MKEELHIILDEMGIYNEFSNLDYDSTQIYLEKDENIVNKVINILLALNIQIYDKPSNFNRISDDELCTITTEILK